MKTLYIECMMGAAGDMLMGALLELIEDRQAFIDNMNRLMPAGVAVKAVPSVKCGIAGTHVRVTVNGEEEGAHGHPHAPDNDRSEHRHEREHDHDCGGHLREQEHDHDCGGHLHGAGNCHGTALHDIEHILGDMDIPQKVKNDALAVYRLIAGAESRVHGVSVDEIHFHEVGNKDAVADIVGCCLLFNEIGADRVIVSPVTTGFGQVRCAHGILPVPAPATAFILNGVPVRSGDIEGELCTPTGAALIRHFADGFARMPVMTIDKTGYGMGNKDFEAANCVRAICGTVDGSEDEVVELCCNLDDMTAEDIGYASEILMKSGALDVFTTAIGMKKSRPGIMLTVMCRQSDRDKMLKAVFRHTTTLGIREYHCRRSILERSAENVTTKYGTLRCKRAEGFGTARVKMEYEDLKEAADRTGMSLDEIRREALSVLGTEG